jgi:hypothetical protein
MNQFSKTMTAAVAAMGVAVLGAAPSFAANDTGARARLLPVHMTQDQGGRGGHSCPKGPGMGGQGMMGPGMGGQGMMGPGMGSQGMMGPGMGGQGMMGPGMGGQGMMGPGMGGQGMMSMMGQMHRGMIRQMHRGMMGPGFGTRVTPPRDLSVDDVRHFLEHRLAHQGYKRLKVGTIKEKDKDTVAADIVTADGSLVQRLEVNRHTGIMKEVE